MSDPSDRDDDAAQADLPPTEDELREAEALRAALDEPSALAARRAAGDHDAVLDVALRARAAVGHAPALDAAVRTAAVEAAVRSPARAADTREVRRRETRSAAPWLAAAAALLVAASGAALAVRFVAEPGPSIARALPDDAYARPSDGLFGAGLPPEQRASERLDAIVASRTRGYFSVLAANVATESEGAAR